MTTLQPYPGWMTDGCKIIGRSLLDWLWLLLVGLYVVEAALITPAARWAVLGRSRFWVRWGVLAASILLGGLISGLVEVCVTAAITPRALSLVLNTAYIAGCVVQPAIVAAMSAASFFLLRLSGCQVGATAAPLSWVASGTKV